MLLESIKRPQDLKVLSGPDLVGLADDTRQFLDRAVARTGGRLGPDLGVESPHGAKKGFKDTFAPQGMFEDLGGEYVGPVDGHDTAAVESALNRAKRSHGPVLVHCLTEKGRGCPPAPADDADRFHTVGAMDPLTCEPLVVPAAPPWTSVFGDEIAAIGAEHPDVLLVSVGALAPFCLWAADLLAGAGIRSTVVDPRWVEPVDEALPRLAGQHRLVAVLDDNCRAGGVGSAVGQALRDAGVDVPLRTFAIPEQFLAPATRGEVPADIGLTPMEIAGRISVALAGRKVQVEQDKKKGGGA